MSAESYGRRWAGEPVKPAQEYFDRLMSQLEAEAPLDASAASLRYDELACMRRALAVAASTRSSGSTRPSVATGHHAAPVASASTTSLGIDPCDVEARRSVSGKCAAAVSALLGPSVVRSEYATVRKPQTTQQPAVPLPTSEQDLDSLLAPRSRAELALRRRGMWSDAGERAACDLLGKWNGEFKRLTALPGEDALKPSVGVDLQARTPPRARHVPQHEGTELQRSAQESRGEAGWAAAWQAERGPPVAAAGGRLEGRPGTAPSTRAQQTPLGNNASAYTCAGPSRFAAGGRTLMPTTAAAAAAAGAGYPIVAERIANATAERAAKAQPNFVQRTAVVTGGADKPSNGKAMGSPTRAQQHQLELEQRRKRQQQQPQSQSQSRSQSPQAKGGEAAHAAHAAAGGGGKPAKRRRWFKTVAVVMSKRGGRESHRFVDIVNGISEFHFGRTTHRYDGSLLVGPPVPAHGFEVAESVRAALTATYPSDARHLHAPRALLEVMVGGMPQMVDGRVYFVALTPVRLLADPARYAALHLELFGDEFYLPAPPLTVVDGGDGNAEDFENPEDDNQTDAAKVAVAERRAEELAARAEAALAAVGATPGIESTPLGVSAALAVAARALARGPAITTHVEEAEQEAQSTCAAVENPSATQPDVESSCDGHGVVGAPAHADGPSTPSPADEMHSAEAVVISGDESVTSRS